MILKTNGQEHELTGFSPGVDTVAFETTEPVELGETVEIWTSIQGEEGDELFLMAAYNVADFLRVEQTGGAVILTNLPAPAPGPAPEPAPAAPSTEDALVQAVVDLQYQVDQMRLGGGLL